MRRSLQTYYVHQWWSQTEQHGDPRSQTGTICRRSVHQRARGRCPSRDRCTSLAAPTCTQRNDRTPSADDRHQPGVILSAHVTTPDDIKQFTKTLISQPVAGCRFVACYRPTKPSKSFRHLQQLGIAQCKDGSAFSCVEYRYYHREQHGAPCGPLRRS